MPAQTGVIVLAAGLSTRFGSGHKLMADVHGRPMIAHVLDMVRTVDPAQRVVVTQSGSRVSHLAEGFDVVINPQPEAGMGRSIALGVAALRPDIKAMFIALGDMPFVEIEAYRALLAAFDGEADIVVPVYDGRQGHPVLFSRVCFDALQRLDGQAGARSMMQKFRVRTVTLPGTAGLVDLDTPNDVANLSGKFDS